MASLFSRKLSRAVGVTATTIGGYTVGAGTQATVIGLSISNITGASVEVDALIHDGANDTYLVKAAVLLPGSTLVVVGGDQKVVLEPSDTVKVRANTASSVDAVMSVLELS